jgi:hypothetical protein
MRYLCMVVLLTGLLAAPSSGVINIKLTADNPNMIWGQTTTIRVLAEGTDAGIASVAGDINALGTAGLLSSNASSLLWVPAFDGDPVNFPAQVGTTGTNGGWSGFGSMQSSYRPMDPTYGKNAFVEIAHYTVTAASGMGQVNLSFSESRVEGFRPVETDQSTVMGSITPVTISVTPEPITLSLLALGGLVAARRRSR